MSNGKSAAMKKEESVRKGEGAKHFRGQNTWKWVMKGAIAVCVGLKIQVGASALRRAGPWLTGWCEHCFGITDSGLTLQNDNAVTMYINVTLYFTSKQEPKLI